MVHQKSTCLLVLIVLVMSLIAKASSASIRASNTLDDRSFTEEEVARGRWEAYRYHGIGPDKDHNRELRGKRGANPTDPKTVRTQSQAVLKGRFGGPSIFDAETLKLPGKKGIGYTLGEVGSVQDWTVHLPRVKFLNTSWNYSWNPKVSARSVCV
jgi:hypothetical protein